jgi:CRISPR-associated protein Cas6
MYWNESTEKKKYIVPDDIVDVAFRINCKCLPLEHAHALSQALHGALPWLESEKQAGVHLIHGAESGNGWMRPEDVENEVLYVSRRTRMTLRLPRERLGDVEALVGKVLDVGGYAVEVGESAVKALTPTSIIFARYVVTDPQQNEESFINMVVAELQQQDVQLRKLLCGKSHSFRTPTETIFTRSLMLADLEIEDAVKLQQLGVGPGRKLGFGLFIPHKGIAAVAGADEE